MRCFKCSRELPMEMFKSQSRSGVTKRADIPRQCLDCLRAWHKGYAERRRRAIGMRTLAERHPPEAVAANREKKRLKSLARIKELNARMLRDEPERLKAIRAAAWKRLAARDPAKAKAALARGQVSRRVGLKNRTPSWGQEGIGDVYLEAEYFQMEVDHIIPLQARKASGLHVWDNLQLLPRSVNRAKRNSFDPVQFNPL